jgi:DNA-binding response OmpR family regulator
VTGHPDPAPVSQVLIAEDNPRIAFVLDKALRRAQLHPCVVDDPVAAVRAATAGPFTVLILDLDRVPAGSGR